LVFGTVEGYLMVQLKQITESVKTEECLYSFSTVCSCWAWPCGQSTHHSWVHRCWCQQVSLSLLCISILAASSYFLQAYAAVVS